MQNIVETFLSIFDRSYDGAAFPAVDTLSIDQAYAIQADVIGRDKTKKPFFGLVKIKEGKIFYYRVLPKE